MSERWADSFSFRGRLSRAGGWRLERRYLLVASFGWVSPMLLLLAGAPRAWALAPALLVPVSLLALLAANVRRLHDVGRHAGGELVRDILVFFLIVGPAATVFLLPDLLGEMAWIPLVFSAVAFVVAIVSGLFRGRPTWRPGDEGPNEFGPPPAR